MGLADFTPLVESGSRIAPEDALRLRETASLFDLGRLASIRRRALHGDRVTYTVNLHINVTNVCANRCRFCAFRRDEGDAVAYTMSPEAVWRYAEENAPPGVREFHLVSALNPRLALGDYETILRGLRERFPQVHLKAFTAVEIDFLARRENLSIEEALRRLMNAGLGSLPGGGAETLSPRVRGEVCPDKLDGEGYLDVHRRAHRLGLRSTATLLFGHVETVEERIEHLLRLRELQDETGGFTAFVPLVFHPENTRLSHLPRATARDILETIALSRLMLDNVPHIKAYWVSLGPKLAQIALGWGADDLDGTVGAERIHRSAGAASPKRGLSVENLRRAIREAGFVPVERDALYRPVCESFEEDKPSLAKETRDGGHFGVRNLGSVLHTRADLESIAAGRARMTADEAQRLLAEGDLIELGRAADAVRRRLHPEPVVTYAIDRNINTTNECLSLCEFCAFAREASSAEAFVLDRETIASKIEELCARGGRQILMQGGLSPRLDLAWYEDLFRWMRAGWPDLHIHALSPPEIVHLASGAGLGWRETIARLRRAGLDSIPGGGAEILSDRLRARLSPRKCTADEWIGIMRAAHEEGLRTSATMVIGLGETAAERAEHLERIRTLQDETSGFTAFIVWTFQPQSTPLARGRVAGVDKKVDEVDDRVDGGKEVLGAGAWEYLRTLAVARLFLDNVENFQASWVTQGAEVAQLALLFGANDFGSTMLEENVVAAAGTRFRMGVRDFERLAADLGMRAAQRDFFYRLRPESDKLA